MSPHRLENGFMENIVRLRRYHFLQLIIRSVNRGENVDDSILTEIELTNKNLILEQEKL